MSLMTPVSIIACYNNYERSFVKGGVSPTCGSLWRGGGGVHMVCRYDITRRCNL